MRGFYAEDRCYPFFKYDYMLKVRLRMHEARKVVYGTEIPRIIPGSKEFWRSFGLDLVAFVEQRGLPDFFLILLLTYLKISPGILTYIGPESVSIQINSTKPHNS